MKKIFFLLIVLILFSCKAPEGNKNHRIITVSIAPFKYFVEAIAGDDFEVNIMVPSGSDPHVYEPVPEQINKLIKSSGYISNGYLGFEMNWLDRFYETNPAMKRLSLGEKIIPIASGHNHEGEHVEGADPHYWVSPKCALIMAASVKDFLSELFPPNVQKYQANYLLLRSKILQLDSAATVHFENIKNKSFMIYHPNLAYLARDYGLEEIPVEFEGKEPPPSRIKEMIDHARHDSVNTILLQREYDPKNAKAIADEIGAKLVIIDPLSEDWMKSTSDILTVLYKMLTSNSR